MGTELETKHAIASENIQGAQVSTPINQADVAPLAAWADSHATGKYAWVCTACGSRGVGWQMVAEPIEARVDIVTKNHEATSRGKCPKPAISLTFEDVNAAKLLGTPAASIKAQYGPKLPAPVDPSNVA